MNIRGFHHRAAAVALAALFTTAAAAANDYTRQRESAIRECRDTDPTAYQTGLLFNPAGYRSYYHRSLCYQNAAVTFRDPELCTQIKQRRALFSSSWGYSESNCRKLAGSGIDEDAQALDAMKSRYESGHVRITDFTIERNGNGRDIDIVPQFAGAGDHAYRLTFEIIRGDPGAAPVLLHSAGFHLRGAENKVRIFIKQEELRARFPDFEMGGIYKVRAVLTYATGYGSQNGKWSDEFIESRFPVADRSQSLIKDIPVGRE